MFRLLTYLVSVAFIFIQLTHAQQVDPQLCPDGPTPPFPDPKWHHIPPRFEIMTELVAERNILELSQAFSTSRDAIATNSAIGPNNFYYNFVTNEFFEIIYGIGNISMPFCVRQTLNDQSQTSVVVPRTLMVKPSALLGYDQRNKPNAQWGVRFESEGELRRIPTNIFRSCFYLNDIRATVLVFFHVSDPTKFLPGFQQNQTTILQMNVTVKNATTQDSFTYNVFRYNANPSRREERQALETPTGVYCQNRTSTMPIPKNLPERVSANTEVNVPFGNQSAIFSGHNLYDTEFQFTRFDAWYPDRDGSPQWEHFTEIHDHGVGLTYRYSSERHHCRVHNISAQGNDAVPDLDDPNNFHMGSPQHLFLLDDAEYQYTGEKHCRDRVWCHVWIAEKVLPGYVLQHREWYWSSHIEGEPVVHSEPVKLVLKQYNNGVLNTSFEMNIFNYRRRPMTIFEIDYTLAECYRALGPAENYNLAVLTFRIINDKKYPVYENLNYLRFHIWETLVFTMFVRPIRISHLIVDQDNGASNDIIVTFTLLDRPPITGNVADPIHETSLDGLINRLERIMEADGLAFRAKYGTNTVNLRARPGSLNVGHRSSETITKSSGPKITGLWIGLIIVGLLIGGVGGFFLFGKFAKK
ncbi:unnamed protein product [Adineta steineri]|uniref:Uncharacterized protein n=1 Tax=Adineta steineri TaxID=433720 RepID=A0A813R3B6_9BILA|nr:unnamed protein product [Adineta steineri]